MTLPDQRRSAIADSVQQIRALEAEHGISRQGVEAFKSVLLELAKQTELFPTSSFPGPADENGRPGCLYRLYEDTDHRFALYANVSNRKLDSPAHNHTTWAVVVGMRGTEWNRFYQRTNDGVEVTSEVPVTDGTGVALLPDDIHSIHITGQEPVFNFHMYGMALTHLHDRQYYNQKHGDWRSFPAATDIREPLD